MVRSVTVFDEDYTEEDMAAALDWQEQQGNICSGCGGWLDETTAPGSADKYDAELLACNRCAVADAAERGFREKPNAVTDGLRHRTWEIED